MSIQTPPLPPDSIAGNVYVGEPRSDDPASGEEFRIFVDAESTQYGISARLIGNVAAGAFFEIFNLLNVDTLRVYEIDNRVVNLQSEETRRFGRRFQFGVQLDF